MIAYQFLSPLPDSWLLEFCRISSQIILNDKTQSYRNAWNRNEWRQPTWIHLKTFLLYRRILRYSRSYLISGTKEEAEVAIATERDPTGEEVAVVTGETDQDHPDTETRTGKKRNPRKKSSCSFVYKQGLGFEKYLENNSFVFFSLVAWWIFFVFRKVKTEEEEPEKPKVVPLSLEELLAKRKAEQEAQSKVRIIFGVFCSNSKESLVCCISAQAKYWWPVTKALGSFEAGPTSLIWLLKIYWRRHLTNISTSMNKDWCETSADSCQLFVH